MSAEQFILIQNESPSPPETDIPVQFLGCFFRQGIRFPGTSSQDRKCQAHFDKNLAVFVVKEFQCAYRY